MVKKNSMLLGYHTFQKKYLTLMVRKKKKNTNKVIFFLPVLNILLCVYMNLFLEIFGIFLLHSNMGLCKDNLSHLKSQIKKNNNGLQKWHILKNVIF